MKTVIIGGGAAGFFAAINTKAWTTAFIASKLN